jgi:hypothetical protein
MPSTPSGPRVARRRRFGTRSIGSLLVLRFLLIANALTLIAVGLLYVVYGAKPGGFIVGGVLIGASLLLVCCIPLTNPYRERTTARRVGH